MMGKRIILLILSYLIVTSCLFVSAQKNYSDWAEESILMAENCGMFTQTEENWDFTQPMKRGEMVPLLLRAYGNVTKEKIPQGDTLLFSDGGKEETSVSLLGIMNGVGNGLFSPGTPITREQIAKIILTLKAVCQGEELTLPPAYYNPLADFMAVSDWAKPYVEKAYNEGIVTGYEDGNFYGEKSVSKEEAVALLVRSVALVPVEEEDVTEEAPVYSDRLEWNVEKSYESGELTVAWSLVKGVSSYTLTVIEQRNSRYEGDIPPNEQIYEYTTETAHTLYLYPNRTYTLSLSAGNDVLTAEFYVPKLYLEDMAEIEATLPQTKEDADPLMVAVTVPVWKMKADGTKYSSTAEIMVHSTIAKKVELVFEEIYNGKEQFPIKDTGGYAWRGGKTEHNWGTAIDLNSNENYCLYKDGTAVGECWSPYENPYSFPPYGDVVNAFEKYGFTWGGDAWSNPKDYMHFSYLGT